MCERAHSPPSPRPLIPFTYIHSRVLRKRNPHTHKHTAHPSPHTMTKKLGLKRKIHLNRFYLEYINSKQIQIFKKNIICFEPNTVFVRKKQQSVFGDTVVCTVQLTLGFTMLCSSLKVSSLGEKNRKRNARTFLSPSLSITDFKCDVYIHIRVFQSATEPIPHLSTSRSHQSIAL